MKWIRLVAIVSLVSAIVLMTLIGWTYRRDRARFQNVYTRTVKQRDISDTARKSLAALQDAVVREQGYVLTGETAYSEAYADDIREWQDEFGTLEVVAQHDAVTALVKDLSSSAKRVLDELAASTALVDSGSREAALYRMRKGSAAVYLGQAREVVTKIQQQEGLAADESDQKSIRDTLLSQRRLATAALALFCLAITTSSLLMLRRRGMRAVESNAVGVRGQYLQTHN